MPESTPAFSVIIPVHNAAPFLPSLFAALQAQTLTDIEYLLIDDGSRDGSAALLQQFVAACPAARLLTRAQSGGASAARNLGLTQARGRWIGFCDADDLPAPTLYQRLLELGEAAQLDLVLVNGASFSQQPGDQAGRLFEGLATDAPLDGLAWLAKLVASGQFVDTLWLMAWRRPVGVAAMPGFREGMVHEDTLWVQQLLPQLQRIGCYDELLYHYRSNPDSLMRSADQTRMRHRLDSRLQLIEATLTQARQLGGQWQALLTARAQVQAMDLFGRLHLLESRQARRDLCRQVRQRGLWGQLWRSGGSCKFRRRLLRGWWQSLGGKHD